MLLLLKVNKGIHPVHLSKFLIKIQKKSLVANDGLITDLRAKINSEESTLSEKSTITDLMLQHFIEKGEFLEFKKLYNQHAVLFKNDPLKLYYWNSIYYNYRGEYSKSLDASRQHLREAQKSRINDELSKSYRILAKSHMYLNSKDSSLYYSNLSLNFARRSNSENAILNTFKVQAEVYNHFGMIGQSTSVLNKIHR